MEAERLSRNYVSAWMRPFNKAASEEQCIVQDVEEVPQSHTDQHGAIAQYYAL